ncbi:hypothetical protein H4R34_003263 [Dimargaris verticillata]|uniref:Uncharacterized protein n=1 Tax=Dimargaris verticillata TaxID=2761393 RepID=A0A9W8B2H6_9FUNG|nr:hypothetical protein H4R34_003263 [Dimargaris verticillata]
MATALDNFRCFVPLSYVYIPVYVTLIVRQLATACHQLAPQGANAVTDALCTTWPDTLLQWIQTHSTAVPDESGTGFGPLAGFTWPLARSNPPHGGADDWWQQPFYKAQAQHDQTPPLDWVNVPTTPSFVNTIDRALGYVLAWLATGVRFVALGVKAGLQDTGCQQQYEKQTLHYDDPTTPWYGQVWARTTWVGCVGWASVRQLGHMAKYPQLYADTVLVPNIHWGPAWNNLAKVNGSASPWILAFGAFALRTVRDTLLGYIAFALWVAVTVVRFAQPYWLPWAAFNFLRGGLCWLGRPISSWLTASITSRRSWDALCSALDKATVRHYTCSVVAHPATTPFTSLPCTSASDLSCHFLTTYPNAAFAPLTDLAGIRGLWFRDRLWVDAWYQAILAILYLLIWSVVLYETARFAYRLVRYAANTLIALGRRTATLSALVLIVAYIYQLN